MLVVDIDFIDRHSQLGRAIQVDDRGLRSLVLQIRQSHEDRARR